MIFAAWDAFSALSVFRVCLLNLQIMRIMIESKYSLFCVLRKKAIKTKKISKDEET